MELVSNSRDVKTNTIKCDQLPTNYLKTILTIREDLNKHWVQAEGALSTINNPKITERRPLTRGQNSYFFNLKVLLDKYKVKIMDDDSPKSIIGVADETGFMADWKNDQCAQVFQVDNSHGTEAGTAPPTGAPAAH